MIFSSLGKGGEQVHVCLVSRPTLSSLSDQPQSDSKLEGEGPEHLGNVALLSA